ncbi:hypothetical protein ACFSR7_34525 [Cohnella sp. GCM10020058]|uniref:hypothetical protein n=1 Tax=Cohnella sp. GCM10020058 TaxID=3317330 RepID=UPI00362A2132
MRVFMSPSWISFSGDASASLDEEKCGKWMYFFSDKKFVGNLCEDAIRTNVVSDCKHSNAESGVACFYLNFDDVEAHKKILLYFLEHKLIQRTKTGKLYNISFKLDNQTRAGEYGSEFKSDITLSKFVDLKTGEWLLQ